jgi:hypothetical protein
MKAALFLCVLPLTAVLSAKRGRIVVGGAIQLSGKFAHYGAQANNIANWWKDLMNANSSFPFTVDLRLEDDASSRSTALAKDLAMLSPRTSSSPDVLIAPYTSGNSKAICDMLDDNNFSVLCGVWGGASETIFNYPSAGQGQNLRVQSFTPARQYMTSGLEFAYGKLNQSVQGRLPTAALMYRFTDAFSKAVCLGAKDAATAMGFNVTQESVVDPLTSSTGSDTIYGQMVQNLPSGKVPFVDTYDVITNAMDPLLENTDGELADVIFACGLYDSNMAITLSLLARSLRTKFVIMTNAFDSKLSAGVMPYNLVDVMIPTQWEPSIAGEDEIFGTAKGFYDEYTTKFGSSPTYHGASMGGLLVMLTRALAVTADAHTCNAGECELDATTLRAAFEYSDAAVSKDTFYGMVKVDSVGMNSQKPMLSTQVQLGEGGAVLTVPAAPERYIPSTWTVPVGTTYPRWPARKWLEAKIDFLNAYCGGAGFYLEDMAVLQAAKGVPQGPYGAVATAGTGTCSSCPTGKSRPLTLFECHPCSPGSTASTVGQASCDLCPVGRAVQSTGQSSCALCAPGKFAGEVGREFCLDCPAGQYISDGGQSACELCPLGSYQPTVGSVTCERCLSINPLLTTATSASSSNSSCVCKEGYFHDTAVSGMASSGYCKACPKGMSCAVGVEFPPPLNPGYWSSIVDPLDIYECKPLEKCEGGAPETCAGGRTGFLCARCPVHQRVVDEECVPCDSANSAYIVFFFIAYLVFPLVLYRLVNNEHKWKLLPMESIVIMVEALIELCQVIAIVATSAIVWPPLMTGIMDIFAVFGFEISELAAFECMITYDQDYKLYWPSSVVIPGIMLEAFVVHWITQMLPAKFKMYTPFTWNMCGKIINTLYVSQVALGMTPFVCYAHPEPNERSSLVSYPGTICTEGDWVPIAIAGVVSLILSAIYFAYMCFELRRMPQKMQDSNGSDVKQYMQSITFLIEDFRADVYYWNIPMKVAEVVFAVVFVIAAGDALKERVFLTAIFLLCLFGMARFWPYKGPLCNLIVSFTYGVLVMVLLPASTHESSDQEEFGEQVMFFFTVVCVVSFAFGMSVGVANVVKEGKHGSLFAFVMLRKKVPNLDEIAQSWDQIRKIDEKAMLEYLSSAQIYDINKVENLLPILAPSASSNQISASNSMPGDASDVANVEGAEEVAKNEGEEIEETELVNAQDMMRLNDGQFSIQMNDELETKSQTSVTI